MCNELGEIDLRFSYRSAKLPGELSPRALSLLGSRSAKPTRCHETNCYFVVIVTVR
jgi:hypothetical protein